MLDVESRIRRVGHIKGIVTQSAPAHKWVAISKLRLI